MSRFENFTPPTLGSELSTAEITMVEEITALADSGDGKFLKKVGGSVVNVAVPAESVSSHIQVDSFTTTAGQQTFTATKALVDSTILLIINGQPLMPADWTFVAPNQIQTVSNVFPTGLPALWIYIY